jgi:hypothetical protein
MNRVACMSMAMLATGAFAAEKKPDRYICGGGVFSENQQRLPH